MDDDKTLAEIIWCEFCEDEHPVGECSEKREQNQILDINT